MPKRKQNISPACLNKCINNSLKGNMSCIQNQTIVHRLEKYKECFHHFRFYRTKRVKSEHNGQFIFLSVKHLRANYVCLSKIMTSFSYSTIKIQHAAYFSAMQYCVASPVTEFRV